MTLPTPRSAPSAIAAAVALAGLSCVLAPRVAAADPSAPKSAAECRAIADFAQRGQCWDALDREGLHDEQVVKKRTFGLGLAPPDTARSSRRNLKRKPRPSETIRTTARFAS